MPSDVAIGAGRAGPRRSPFAHAVAQNIGLILAVGILALVIVLYCGVFLLQQSRLPGNFELTSTVNNTLPLAMAAIGQSFAVLTKGIDLSVGGMIDLTNAMAAVLIEPNVGSMIGWSIAIVLVGAVLGLINGLIVGLGRLQPIVVTLATLSIYQGLAIRVLPQPGGSIPPDYTAVLANPNQPWSLAYVVLAGLLWLLFRRSRLGVSLFALGNDEEAARARGVRARNTKIIAYTLTGVFCGIAGLFLAATATAGDATTGNGYTLSSIVAVVLGGISLFGGRGSAIGASAGAFITTMIVNVLFFSHIDPLYQAFYEAIFLVVAVLLGSAFRHVMRRRHG